MTKERRYLSIRVDSDVADMIRSFAQDNNMTLGDAVVSLIKDKEQCPQ